MLKIVEVNHLEELKTQNLELQILVLVSLCLEERERESDFEKLTLKDSSHFILVEKRNECFHREFDILSFGF